MTFEEFEKEVERMKEKSAETDKRLKALEEAYARLRKDVYMLENRVRQKLY